MIFRAKYTKTDYKIGDYVAIYMPLPVSERANNKFKSRLRVLYQIIQVISDQNYLLEELATGRRKVVHHNLMRYIPGTLAQRIADRNNLSKVAIETQEVRRTQEVQDSDEEQYTVSEWDEDDIELHGMKSQYKETQRTQASNSSTQLTNGEVVELRCSKRIRQPPRWLNDYAT